LWLLLTETTSKKPEPKIPTNQKTRACGGGWRESRAEHCQRIEAGAARTALEHCIASASMSQAVMEIIASRREVLIGSIAVAVGFGYVMGRKNSVAGEMVRRQSSGAVPPQPHSANILEGAAAEAKRVALPRADSEPQRARQAMGPSSEAVRCAIAVLEAKATAKYAQAGPSNLSVQSAFTVLEAKAAAV
jgi:hypothetical protein